MIIIHHYARFRLVCECRKTEVKYGYELGDRVMPAEDHWGPEHLGHEMTVTQIAALALSKPKDNK